MQSQRTLCQETWVQSPDLSISSDVIEEQSFALSEP